MDSADVDQAKDIGLRIISSMARKSVSLKTEDPNKTTLSSNKKKTGEDIVSIDPYCFLKGP